MTNSKPLSGRDQEAVVYFWAMLWAVVVLNPSGQRGLRGMMVSMGLVKPKGALALTPAGKRVMTFATADDRPRYPVKKGAR